MIKIEYVGKAYNYGDDIGRQDFDINTQIEIKEDASLDQVFDAFIQIVKVAGYSEVGLPQRLHEMAYDLEDDLKETAKFINRTYPEGLRVIEGGAGANEEE